MIDNVLYGLLIFMFVRSLYKSFRQVVKAKKMMRTMDEEQGFSSVHPDSFQEMKNIIAFLAERESGLGIGGNLMFRNQMSIMMCDLSELKKNRHPRFLAFIRAAHMAGFTLSVRRKDRAEQEKVANAENCLFEYVTKIEV